VSVKRLAAKTASEMTETLPAEKLEVLINNSE